MKSALSSKNAGKTNMDIDKSIIVGAEYFLPHKPFFIKFIILLFFGIFDNV
jgi:hypothetical protein